LVPQTAVRFAGFGCWLTAARRHAGGVARTLLERAKREKRMEVLLGIMLKVVV
jgi:hypothetical protein